MNMDFSYRVLAVYPEADMMDVEYSSPGRQPMVVSTRIPFEGESLDDVARMFSPVNYWVQKELKRVPPPVGAAGAFVTPPEPPMTLDRAKALKLQELAAWRFERETAGVSFGGAKIKTDRESQATISGAFASLQSGLIQSVDWKAADEQWVTLTITEMTAIAQAVAAHVQASFTAEKQLAAQVAAASTIEAVQAIVVPWGQSGPQIPVTEV